MEIREAISCCKTKTPGNDGSAKRILRFLYMGGISTMEQLCEMARYRPEEIRKIRGIGPHSMEQIFEIARSYQDAGGRTDGK